MQKYFKTNARVSWELSNTKTLKAHSGFISFPVFGNHDKPLFAVFVVLYHVEYDYLLDGVPR